MPEARLSVRVDEDAKNSANAVFQKLGMNMSTGINVFLNQVAVCQGIPFPLTVGGTLENHVAEMEQRVSLAVDAAVADIKTNGNPVARYDAALKRPYLEFADGRKVYDIEC
jgi:DNA-damage-inducible protein J